MKRILLFEAFSGDFEKHLAEKQVEVKKVEDIYFSKSKVLTDSYLSLINEAGQELIDAWEATSKFDHTLHKFLFKIEVGKITITDSKDIFNLLAKFEKKMKSEFTISYRLVIDIGHNIYKEAKQLSEFGDHINTEVSKARKTLIQVWLS